MSNLEAQIKPSGLKQKNLVDVLYMMIAAIKGICAKLDDDTGVTLDTYEANVYTAIFNGDIEDSRGNRLRNMATNLAGGLAQDKYYSYIRPQGVDEKSLNEIIYQIFDMMETLTEQLDTDNLGDSDYEALCYTALYLWMITNQKGDTLGNGNTYWFNPGGMTDQKQLVDLLAQFVNSIDVLTKKLDDDGTVNGTNYEALWDTAVFLIQIEDSKGNRYGNALTKFNP